jgi:putative CocE/NonD family hydrolase
MGATLPPSRYTDLNITDFRVDVLAWHRPSQKMDEDVTEVFMRVWQGFSVAALLAFFLVVLSSTPARLEEPGQLPERFDEHDVMIPMRDGVRLHTKIFIPAEAKSPLPFLIQRTPYGIEDSLELLDTRYAKLADDGYIFVFQDIRGKFGSEGTFVMQRPARPPGDTSAVDEGTDTYDTIEWLVQNIAGNNSRAGLIGVSYAGWTAIMGALEPHPALAAVSPQASPADMWLGDDFHHNGAFRLSYGFEYAYAVESGKEWADFDFDRHDTFDWYLSLGSLANVNAHLFKGRIPTWNDFVAHPDYDEFWKRQTLIPQISDVKVPTLNVAGWWDQEDFYGPLAIYRALESYDTEGVNYLVAGPWKHGGWREGPADRLGAIPFDSATGKFYREQIQAPWLAYYLKGVGELDMPEAFTFEAGTNQWQRWNTWPPTARTEARPLYLRADERLSFVAPTDSGADATDSYVSDPAHPVPYRHRPIQATYFPGGSTWSTWLVEDQRFVDDRGDVLSWESEPLAEDLTIAGEVLVHLFASTTGSDADWVVKLIDVYPERYPENWDLAGYQLMVSNEVFRGRYRTSFERPEPITPGQVFEYPFSLHDQNYTFRKGHRLMVQVQSSWFPIIDRNPQTFVPNIFEAEEGAFQSATQSIHRSAEYPSHLVLPVVVK